MRIIRAVFVIALFVAILGFYRGWFSLSSFGHDAFSNKVEVRLTVDPDKIKEDAASVKAKKTELSGAAPASSLKPVDSASGNATSGDP